MTDIVFIAVIIGFFALAALYVRGCAAIIGPDELATLSTASETGTESSASTSEVAER